MPFTTLSLGLTLTIPTSGTRSWGTTMFNTTWTKISNHDHTASGNGAQIGTTALVTNAVTSAKLAKNWGFYRYTSTSTPTGSTQTINWNNGLVQKMTLASASGDVTVTLSNPEDAAIYVLYLIQGATARDVIWPASVKWPQGQKPILSTTNTAIDKITLTYDGTSYYGDWNLDYQ